MGAPVPNSTGVIGVLDSDNTWQVYQYSINPNQGLASVTRDAAGSGGVSGASSLPTSADLTNPQGTQGFTGLNDSSLTNEDGSPAQVLPNLPHVSVVGVLNAAHSWKMYRVSFNPNTSVLSFDLADQLGSGPIPAQMYLLDATGRTIADTTHDPASRDLTMDVPITDQIRSSPLYLKIAAPSSSFSASTDSASSSTDAAPPSDNYVLQVTQQDRAISPSASPPQNPAASQDNASSSETIVQTTQTSPAPARTATVLPATGQEQGGLGPLPVASASPVGPQLSLNQVATGPLPERASAALGGVLDEGDPVPQLDRHDPALVDLALLGLPQGLAEADGVADADDLTEILDSLDVIPDVKDPLVTILGPGGFPLLASSLREVPAPDFDALVAVLPTGAAVAPALATPAPAVAPASFAVETTADARAKALPAASALSGLTVAVAMVFGVRLPDMTAFMTIGKERRARLRLRLGSLLRRRSVG